MAHSGHSRHCNILSAFGPKRTNSGFGLVTVCPLMTQLRHSARNLFRKKADRASPLCTARLLLTGNPAVCYRLRRSRVHPRNTGSSLTLSFRGASPMKPTTAMLALAMVAATPALAAGTFQVEEATIADIHKAIRDKLLTCHRLVQNYLDRIAGYDHKGPALDAILALNPNALAEDERLD